MITSKLSRRRFLTAATLAAGAVATAGSAQGATKRPIRKAIMFGTLGIPNSVSVLDRFKLLKEAGFEGVEPGSHMDQDEILRARDATGLVLPSVCCSTHWDKPLSDPDPEVREKGLEGLRQALRDAKRYGATSVLLVPGVVKGPVTYDDCWTRSITEIRKVIPMAEDLGVKIAIEDVWNNFITTPAQAGAYLDAINSPFVGWHFDIGNMIKYSPPETWIPVLGKRILKLHLKEYSKAKGFGVEFFQGDNNWPAIMKALDDVGYHGWGITEQPGEQTATAERLKHFSELLDRVFAS